MFAFLRNLLRRQPKMPAPSKLPELKPRPRGMPPAPGPYVRPAVSYHPPLNARPRPVTPFRAPVRYFDDERERRRRDDDTLISSTSWEPTALASFIDPPSPSPAPAACDSSGWPIGIDSGSGSCDSGTSSFDTGTSSSSSDGGW